MRKGTTVKNNERIALWDNLKFLLILLVVIGHFAEQVDTPLFRAIFLFIYSFHMPLFIFISGHFHRNTNIGPKIFSYLLIGFLLKFVIFIIRQLLGYKQSFSLFSESGLPWYMFAMAAFIFLAYLLRNFNLKRIFFVSVIFACFAGYDQSVNDFLCLSRIIVYFPFYILGMLVNVDKLKNENHNLRNKLIGGGILSAYGLSCISFLDRLYVLRPLFTGRNPFSEQFFQFGCLWRLLCYSITIILGIAIIWIIPDHHLRGITTLGTRTLQVYFWHRLILYVLVALNITVLCNTAWGEIVYIGIAVSLTFILSQNIFSFPTKQIFDLF